MLCSNHPEWSMYLVIGIIHGHGMRPQLYGSFGVQGSAHPQQLETAQTVGQRNMRSSQDLGLRASDMDGEKLAARKPCLAAGRSGRQQFGFWGQRGSVAETLHYYSYIGLSTYKHHVDVYEKCMTLYLHSSIRNMRSFHMRLPNFGRNLRTDWLDSATWPALPRVSGSCCYPTRGHIREVEGFTALRTD